MYFEIYRDGNLITRGDRLLGGIEWDNSLMETPTMRVTIPVTYFEYLTGWEDFKIFVNGKCFWGIVVEIVVDKAAETMELTLYHKVHEWTFRQISVNNAIKDKKVNIVYKGSETGTSGNTTVTASPFTMLLSEIGTFTSKKYIQRAGASAWTNDGQTVPVTVNASAVKSKEGDYDVIFTANGASVTVPATVEENATETTRDDYTLKANNFSMLSSEVGTLTAEDYIRKANATCTPSLPITVDYSSIRRTDGTYSVKFTAKYEKDGEEQEITVNVTAIVSGNPDADATIADNIGDIFSDRNFAYPGWVLNMSERAANWDIDYVYSRQNKLEALTKTCELTTDIFWRTRPVNEKVIDISEFGEEKQWIISTKPSGVNNVRLIDDPVIEYDFDHVINMATVYSEKSDTGMASMTLREVYMNEDLWEEGFPVYILRAHVNNERDYTPYHTQYPKLAPNNELEYCVIDEESVVMENGTIIEGTYAFNDLAPITTDSDEEVKDSDRIIAAKKAYDATIRKLKQARRRYKIQVVTEEWPVEVNPGDKVILLYDNNLYITDECSDYQKKILSMDDWFYVSHIHYEIDETGAEVDTVTLEKEIRIDRELPNEV